MIEVFLVAAGAMLCFGLGGIIARRPSTYVYNESDETIAVDVKGKNGAQFTTVPPKEGRWLDTQGDITITDLGTPRQKKDYTVKKVKK